MDDDWVKDRSGTRGAKIRASIGLENCVTYSSSATPSSAGDSSWSAGASSWSAGATSFPASATSSGANYFPAVPAVPATSNAKGWRCENPMSTYISWNVSVTITTTAFVLVTSTVTHSLYCLHFVLLVLVQGCLNCTYFSCHSIM